MNQLLISFLALVATLEPQAAEDISQDRDPAPPEILPPPGEDLSQEVAAEMDPVLPPTDLTSAQSTAEASPVSPMVLAPAADSVAPSEPQAVNVAFADLSDAELFSRAAKAIEEIDTMTARFEQVSPSGHETTGTLSLDRPGRLRFDYDQPSDQLVVATGGVVYVHDAALETTDSYPVSKTPLRFLLSRRIDTDKADLREVYRSEDGAAILLAATDEDVTGELALVFSAPDLQLKEWVVIEPNGASTRVTLSDVKLGKRLPGRLFRVPDSGGAFLRDR